MSAREEPSTSTQVKRVLDEVMTLMDRKGFEYDRTLGHFWQGGTITLPPALRDRARASEESAKNFHVDAQLVGVSALNELAVVTFVARGDQPEGSPKALLYKVMLGDGLQDLSLECHERTSLMPKIPDDRERERIEGYGLANASDSMSWPGFGDPDALLGSIVEISKVTEFQYKMEIHEQESRARAVGNFVTTAAEADELAALVHGFAEA